MQHQKPRCCADKGHTISKHRIHVLPYITVVESTPRFACYMYKRIPLQPAAIGFRNAVMQKNNPGYEQKWSSDNRPDRRPDCMSRYQETVEHTNPKAKCDGHRVGVKQQTQTQYRSSFVHGENEGKNQNAYSQLRQNIQYQARQKRIHESYPWIVQQLLRIVNRLLHFR